MNKNKVSGLLIAVMLLLMLLPILRIDSYVKATPQRRVVFEWVNQTAKKFRVKTSYIECYFEGEQGGSLIEIKHYAVPNVDFVDDVKMAATGPDIGWTSSRWGIDISNVTVSYREIEEDLLEVNVTALNNNIKFEHIFYFTDSDVILVWYRATLLADINLTSIGAEFVPATIATSGAQVVCTDYFGNLITHTLNGSMAYIVFGNASEGTLPLKENWMAVYNPDINVFAGIIWLDPEMFISDKSTVGVWDGAVWSVASLVSRWFEDPKGKVFPKGTTFENYLLIVVGSGSYDRIRALSELVRNINSYYQRVKISTLLEQISSLQSAYSSLQSDYNSLQTQYNTLQTEYNSLKAEFDEYKAQYTVTQAQLQQTQTTSIIIGVVIGLIIGFALGWFIKKKK